MDAEKNNKNTSARKVSNVNQNICHTQKRWEKNGSVRIRTRSKGYENKEGLYVFANFLSKLSATCCLYLVCLITNVSNIFPFALQFFFFKANEKWKSIEGLFLGLFIDFKSKKFFVLVCFSAFEPLVIL